MHRHIPEHRGGKAFAPYTCRPHVLNVAKVTEGWVPFRPYTCHRTDSQGCWDMRFKSFVAILAKERASSGSDTQTGKLFETLALEELKFPQESCLRGRDFTQFLQLSGETRIQMMISPWWVRPCPEQDCLAKHTACPLLKPDVM